MKIKYFFILLLILLVPSSATVYLESTTSSVPCVSCDGDNLTVTGNISASFYYGDGSKLDNLPSGSGISKWIDLGNDLMPNSTFADNLFINGSINITGNLYNGTHGFTLAELNTSFTTEDIWINESGDTMTGDLNMSDNNITSIDYSCFNGNCTSYIYHNGTHLIIQT